MRPRPRPGRKRSARTGFEFAIAQGDVSDPASAEAMVRKRREPTRPDRYPDQQRRHHARHHVPQDERDAVAGSDQHQPRLVLQRHPPGHRRHAQPQMGPHRADQLDQWPEGPVRPGELRSGEGRHARFHDLAGAGKREVRHHREHGLAGLRRHRHGDGRARRRARENRRADSDRPPRRPDEIALRGRRSSPTNRHAGSPAPTSPSTAASTWVGDARIGARHQARTGCPRGRLPPWTAGQGWHGKSHGWRARKILIASANGATVAPRTTERPRSWRDDHPNHAAQHPYLVHRRTFC